MSSRRPLLPAASAPPDAPPGKLPLPPPPPSLSQQNARRALTHAACSTCRKRKTKCDGGRPACGVCTSSGRECLYDTEKGETRTAALKNRNIALQRHLDSATQALRMLQATPDPEADYLYQRLRLATDLPAFLSNLDPSLPAEPPEIPRAQTQLAWIDASGVLRYIRDNIESIRYAFTVFTERTAMLFHVYTEDDAAQTLAHACQPALLDLPTPMLCETCSIVAIVSHFNRYQIPPNISDLMYSVAKHFLDDLITHNPIRAIKACTLLAFCNIVTKATIGLTYVDIGLGIARNLGLYGQERPHTIDFDSWYDAKKVWRSLVLCKGWLQATLGYLTDESAYPTCDISFEACGVWDSQEFFRTEFTKIAILKGKILGTATHPYLLQETIDGIRSDLRSWYTALPPQWNLSQNLSNINDRGLRITTSYLHLLHLGTMMLLHRRVVHSYIQLQKREPGRAFEMIAGAAEAVTEGITAARFSARLLSIVHDEGGITRHCWVCIFQAYMSCCTMLYTSFHRRLQSADPGLESADDIQFSEQAFTVLTMCAELDPGAVKLRGTLLPYVSMLKDTVQNYADDSGSAGYASGFIAPQPTPSLPPPLAVSSEHLFPPEGTSTQHQACRELFGMLSRPFGTFSSVRDEDTQPLLLHKTMCSVDELGLGIHVDRGGYEPVSNHSGNFGGHFPDEVHGEPFGWTRLRCSVEHTAEAKTLDIG